MTFWVLGVATVGSALISANASGKAADAQADAARDSSATQLAMFDRNREDMAPWRAAGETALGQLGTGTAAGGEFNSRFSMGDFQQDPGYQFRLAEGQRALERSAAARGGALGGGSLRALTRYGQDYASGEYQNAYNRWNSDQTNRFNRLASLSGIGQTATRDVANMGMTTAGNIGANQLAAGNAAAAGYVGQANAINGGLGNMQSMYMFNRMFPNAGGSSVSSANLGMANQSSDPIGTLSDLQGWSQSDVRRKTDIERVGTRADGLGVYRFRYLAGGPTHIGLMAHEVQALYPHAVKRDGEGFFMVNYDEV